MEKWSRQARMTSRVEWVMPTIMVSAWPEETMTQAVSRSGAGRAEISVQGWGRCWRGAPASRRRFWQVIAS